MDIEQKGTRNKGNVGKRKRYYTHTHTPRKREREITCNKLNKRHLITTLSMLKSTLLINAPLCTLTLSFGVITCTPGDKNQSLSWSSLHAKTPPPRQKKPPNFQHTLASLTNFFHVSRKSEKHKTHLFFFILIKTTIRQKLCKENRKTQATKMYRSPASTPKQGRNDH